MGRRFVVWMFFALNAYALVQLKMLLKKAGIKKWMISISSK